MHDLDKYLDNQNVKAFLEVIKDAEGTSRAKDPYRVFGGGVKNQLENLDKTPDFNKWDFKQTDGKKNRSSATGAYQFISSTWKDLQKQYGFEDFTPRTQDLGAIALLQKSGALPHILAGDFQLAIDKANKTWASLPGSPYAQRTRGMDFVQRSLSKHLGEPVVITENKKENESPKDIPLTETQPQKPQVRGSWIKRIISKVAGFFQRKT